MPGVRSSICPTDGLRWNNDVEYWGLEVRGKNTKGGEKTIRDAYMPEHVKENLDGLVGVIRRDGQLHSSKRAIDYSLRIVRHRLILVAKAK